MPAPLLRLAVLSLALLSPAVGLAQKAPSTIGAPADPQVTARGLAQEGLKLYLADHWTEALATFRQADAIFHAPSVTLYIARCQRKLGKLLESRATYDKLLAEDLPKDASPQFVQAHVEAGQEVEALKHRVPTLHVVVAGVPPGEAQILLDGTPLADGTRNLDPGPHTVEVQRRAARPGEPPVTRTLTLAEASRETLTIDLAGGTSTSQPWFLPGGIALGVGVLGLGVGVVTGAIALVRTNQIKSQCVGTSCPPSLKGDGDSTKAIGYASTTAFAAGGAGVIAGGVLLFLFRPREPPARGQVGWGVSVGVGRVDVEGRF